MSINQKKINGLAVAAVMAMSAIIHSSPVQAAEKGDTKVPTVLFVQNAEAFTFDKATSVLTLKDAGSQVTWFTDRPVRAAGHLLTSSLVKIWNEGADSFKEDPPNANLSVVGGGKVSNVVLELSNPSLKGMDISYKVKVLKGEVPASGEACSLFIDGLLAPANTAGGGAVKGAATGALIGAISGNAGRGAAIGAGVGILRAAINENGQ